MFLHYVVNYDNIVQDLFVENFHKVCLCEVKDYIARVFATDHMILSATEQSFAHYSSGF